MAKIIQSVEVHSNDSEGSYYFKVGTFGGRTISDIIEVNNTFQIYDSEDEIVAEIRNCPVIINYTFESEGDG